MRLHEEFQVNEPVSAVWTFFEQPDLVARCMPGVEAIEILDDDNVSVRATQSIGPMSATFEAKVTVLERVPNELIRFQATGRSVRGAIGNVRTVNAVRLRGLDGMTTVAVDGDVVLAGPLGSVGQKIVAKQAGKVTAEFAENLRRALTGEMPAGQQALPGGQAWPGGQALPGGQAADSTATAAGARISFTPAAAARRGDPWSRVAAVLSAVSVALSIIALARSRRAAR